MSPESLKNDTQMYTEIGENDTRNCQNLELETEPQVHGTRTSYGILFLFSTLHSSVMHLLCQEKQ